MLVTARTQMRVATIMNTSIACVLVLLFFHENCTEPWAWSLNCSIRKGSHNISQHLWLNWKLGHALHISCAECEDQTHTRHDSKYWSSLHCYWLKVGTPLYLHNTRKRMRYTDVIRWPRFYRFKSRLSITLGPRQNHVRSPQMSTMQCASDEH